MNMMTHIVSHSQQVCRVAMCLVDNLAKRNGQLSRDLVQAASLLHDITKTRSFKTGENHASTGGQLLVALGYPEVGHTIRQHVRLDTYFSSRNIIEAEIVNYADKRVLHDKVVSLQKRMSYTWKRYGKTQKDKERLTWLRDKTIALEQRLFQYLPFSPEDLPQQFNPHRPLPQDPEE
jgi:putative nucleotidyltransferase with HDIG domain